MHLYTEFIRDVDANIQQAILKGRALSQIKCDSEDKGGRMGSKAMLGLIKW